MISFHREYLLIVIFLGRLKGGCRGKTQSRFGAKKSKPPLLFTGFLLVSVFCYSVTCMTISIAVILIDAFHSDVLPIVATVLPQFLVFGVVYTI